ncbi:MAG: ATP-binding protein [Acidimicrobiales bacterium]
MTTVELSAPPDAVLVLAGGLALPGQSAAARDLLAIDAVAFIGQPVGVVVEVRTGAHDHGRPTGTGMGLWTSQASWRPMAITSRAACVAGRGSTFRFTLPTHPLAGPHGAPERIGDGPS